MANTSQQFDITRDELDSIGKALKNEEFRKLLVEYCEELTDPESRRRYEEEITQLEKERGVEVTFINPKGCYVIKTSVDGNKIAFINVCTNENVQKPTSVTASKDDAKGINWSVPHLLSPPREDLNKKGKRCTVFDVIFHPDAIKLGVNNTKFRELLNGIACDAVERNHGVNIDKTNLKFPKMLYKGIARPLVIRKRGRTPSEVSTDDPVDKLYSEMYKKMDETSVKKPVTQFEPSSTKTKYTTPKYIIKQRTNVDIQDFTNETTSHGTIPHALIIDIELPLLRSAEDLTLDVTEKSISLVSEKPAKYKLSLCLPYAVNEDVGNAKFNQDSRKLTITLPVRRNLLLCDVGRDDSGVDSDNNSPTSNTSDSPLVEELKDCKIVDEELKNASEVYRTKNESTFLSCDLYYTLPEYSCHLYNEILVFTLHVKNVDPTSLDKTHQENDTKLHIKFSSISPAFVTVHYSFFVNLKTHFIDTDNLSIEIWDNNVIVQMSYKPVDTVLTSYWAGVCEDSAEEKTIQEPSILFNKHINKNVTETEQSPQAQVDVISEENVSITINPEITHTEEPTENMSPEVPLQASKPRSLSESSGEELSVSPTKGILKLGRCHTPISRSVSESSVDDFTWSSLENSHFMSDSLIPEESEVSSSMKKTVRFNDVVSRQIFRSNSSILGQKKKNQRKSRNKKRAQERRQSESENSEVEDQKEKYKKSVDVSSEEGHNNNTDETDPISKIDFKSDLIFDIDM